MVPRSTTNAHAKPQDRKKKACKPADKRLDLALVSDYADHVANKKKSGEVVLHVRAKEAFFSDEVTYTISTRPPKAIKATSASAAPDSQLMAADWLKNTIVAMHENGHVYSPDVQQTMVSVMHTLATQERVVLSDADMRKSLKILAQAKPVAPQRKCPAIPVAVQQPSAGVPDIPPPIVMPKQPKDEANLQVLQAKLAASLSSVYDDMRSRNASERKLFDAQGKVVAQLSIRDRQTGTLICLDEAGDGYCRQGDGLIMGATSKMLYVRRDELSSLEEAKAVAQATHWLALAQRFESEVVPITIDRVAVLKEQALAVNQAMAELYKAMVEKDCLHIWTDGAYQAWTNEVNRKTFHFSSTITKTPDGTPLLTVETHDAYWSEGLKDRWGSAKMSKNESDGSYTVSSFRLNRKDLNADSDFQDIGNLDAALESMKGVLSLTRSFVEDVNRLKAAST